MKRLTTNQLSETLNIIQDIIFVVDKELRIQFVNQRINTLGYEVESIIGKSLYDVISRTNHKAIEKTIDKLKKHSTGIYQVRVTLSTKGGAQIPSIVTFHSQRTRGDIELLVVMSIEKTQGIADDILNSIESGVMLIDTSERILYINNYARRFLGGGDYFAIFQLPKRIREKLFDIAKKGKEHEEIKLSRGRTLGLSSYPFIVKGELKGWILLFKDITEIKLLESAMTNLDRFSTLGTLASGLAHEIKNPLAGMRLMAKNLEKSLTGKNKEMVIRMTRQIDRIDKLVKTFFSYTTSHISQISDCSLKESVEETELLLKDNLRQSKISIRKDIKDGIITRADPNQLQQILLNLILNSIDAMPDGGDILIQGGDSEILSPQGIPYVYLSVRDNGRGMTEEEIEKIFRPFYTTKPEGTGLGLFIVHQLLKENKGFIEVKSQKGKGSTFTIYLQPAIKKQNN